MHTHANTRAHTDEHVIQIILTKYSINYWTKTYQYKSIKKEKNHIINSTQYNKILPYGIMITGNEHVFVLHYFSMCVTLMSIGVINTVILRVNFLIWSFVF